MSYSHQSSEIISLCKGNRKDIDEVKAILTQLNQNLCLVGLCVSNDPITQALFEHFNLELKKIRGVKGEG